MVDTWGVVPDKESWSLYNVRPSEGLEGRAFIRQHQYRSLFTLTTLRMGWHKTGIITVRQCCICLISPHVTRSPRLSPSVLHTAHDQISQTFSLRIAHCTWPDLLGFLPPYCTLHMTRSARLSPSVLHTACDQISQAFSLRIAYCKWYRAGGGNTREWGYDQWV